MFNSSLKLHLLRLFLLTSFFLSIFLITSPLQRAELQVSLESPVESFFRVYWAADGQRFSARRSAFVAYHEGVEILRLKLGNLHNIAKISIVPTRKPTSVTLKALSIAQPGFKTIHFRSSQELAKFIPEGDVRMLTVEDDALQLSSSGYRARLNVALFPLVDPEGLVPQRIVQLAVFYLLPALVISTLLLIAFALLVQGLQLLKEWYPEHTSGNKDKDDVTTCQSGNGILNGLYVLVSLILITVLFVKIYPLYFGSNIFGSRNAPHSDAFVWLRGAIHYWHELPFKTYRPTVNLFFSSIYALTGKTAAIPLFSILLLGLNVGLLLMSKKRIVRLFLLTFLGLLFAFSNELLVPLNLGQIMIDFPSFIFTLFGIFLVGYGLKCRYIDGAMLFVGLFFLGVAAAVRGVQLGGGVIIVLGIMALAWERRQWRKAVWPGLIFLFPIIFDFYLQKKYGTVSNGLLLLFCFYHDSHHTFTKASKDLFWLLDLSGREVLINYFGFLFSLEGIRVLGGYISDILFSSLDILQSRIYSLCLFSTGLLMICRLFLPIDKKKVGQLDSPLMSRLKGLELIRISLHCFVIPGLVWIFTEYSAAIFGCYLLWLLFLGSGLRLYLTTVTLALYLGSGMLFAMMGMPGKERVLASFTFTLPLAYFLFLVEERDLLLDSRSRSLTLFVFLNFAILLFLYGGSRILPIGKKGFDLSEKSVQKVSEEPSKDRALYYTDDGRIFYTRQDDYPVGSSRSFNEIQCNDGMSNKSWKKPCTIE